MKLDISREIEQQRDTSDANNFHDILDNKSRYERTTRNFYI